MEIREMKTQMHCRNPLGFTRIHLVVIFSILATFGIVLSPSIGGGATTAKVNACRANVALMNSQIELYHIREGSWPGELATMVNNPDYYPHGPAACPYSGTGYVYNTKTNRINVHSH